MIRYGGNAATLPDTERRAIRILGTHRATARSGVLIELPCANPELFQKLNELELRCRNGTNNQYIWKAFSDLGHMLSKYFTSFQKLYSQAGD